MLEPVGAPWWGAGGREEERCRGRCPDRHRTVGGIRRLRSLTAGTVAAGGAGETAAVPRIHTGLISCRLLLLFLFDFPSLALIEAVLSSRHLLLSSLLLLAREKLNRNSSICKNCHYDPPSEKHREQKSGQKTGENDILNVIGLLNYQLISSLIIICF